WVGDAAPVATGTLDFSGTGIVNQPSNNDIAAATSFTGITFTNDGTVATLDSAFTLDGNSITLGGDITTTAATTGTLTDTIALDLVLDDTRTITTGASHGLNISGAISDGGGGFGLSVAGNGLTLSGVNTYTGGTLVNTQAVLAVENNSALGTGTVTLNNTNAVLDLAAGLDVGNALIATNFGDNKTIRVLTGSAEYSGNIDNQEATKAFVMNVGSGETLTMSGILSSTSTILTGAFTVNGAGTVVFSGDNTFVKNLSITAAGAKVRLEHNNAAGVGPGAVQMRQTNTLEIADDLIIAKSITATSAGGAKTLVLETGAISAEWAGNINTAEQNGFFLSSDGASELTISGNLTGTEGFIKSGTGTVIIDGAADNTYAGSTTITNGTLKLNKLEAIPSGSAFNMTAGDTLTATLDLNGVSPTLSGFAASGLGSNSIDNTDAGTVTLTIGETDGTGTFEGVIQNTGGDISLTKIGAGSITLSGASTYVGPTSVTAGTLDITGSLTSAVTINDGAALSGNGSTAGLLTLGDGSGLGAIVDIIDSGITSNGLTTNVTGGTVTVNIDPSATGVIDVVNYSGGTLTGGGAADFTIGTGPILGTRAGAGTLSDTGSAITYNTGIGSSNLWLGSVSGNWQVGGDANWQNEFDGTYVDAESVTFDDTGITQSTVTLTSSVVPNDVSLANATGTYTINATSTETITSVGGINASGTGDVAINAEIAGTTAINKSGGGELTLAGDDSFTGGITITEGTLTLSGDKTTTGGTTLTAGTLNINSATALGDAASSFFIGEGTTIDNTSGGPITLTNNNAVTLPNSGFTFGGANDLNLGTGAVTLNLADSGETNVITLNGTGSTLTLGASTSPARGFNVSSAVNGAGNTLVFESLGLNSRGVASNNTWSGDADVTVTGAVTDGATGANTLTYSGTGTFTINGAATYAGNTIVNSGTLALGAGGSLFDETNVTINGGIIDLDAAVNDTIASLTIIGENSGDPLPSGTYGSSTSGADNTGIVGDPDLYFSGTGIFTVPATDPYTVWGGAALFENDPNFDGISNGLAWILGAATPNDDTALSLLPDGAASAGDLVMTFTIVDPIAPATLSVEYTNDLALGPWTAAAVPATAGTVTVGIVEFVVVDNTGTLSVTATIPATAASAGGELFGRLSATEN
ncbi:MAG: autotransporter-associated beta strand repeat-containing protein, partial [Akkermansiaceae bacterium]|nr:autotransporter-associated beta strand repeat-containing protein [Akkermansiaceae bacterium]